MFATTNNKKENYSKKICVCLIKLTSHSEDVGYFFLINSRHSTRVFVLINSLY